MASYKTSRFLRFEQNGKRSHTIDIAAPRWAVAPMLGGADRKTLYLISNETTVANLRSGISKGYLESVRVEIPGAGWP